MKINVGVTIINFNQVQYIKDALDSLTQQDWVGGLEVVVVDDASTNETDRSMLPKIIGMFGSKINIRLIQKEVNVGPNAARNTGCAELVATCEYLVCLDADDKLPPEYITSCVHSIEGFDVCYTPARYFGTKEGITTCMPHHPLRLRAENYIVSSAMFSRSIWARVVGWDESPEMQILEDYCFWLDILKAGGTFTRNNDTYLWYRMKENSRNSSVGAGDKYKKAIKYFRHKFGDFYLGGC